MSEVGWLVVVLGVAHGVVRGVGYRTYTYTYTCPYPYPYPYLLVRLSRGTLTLPLPLPLPLPVGEAIQRLGRRRLITTITTTISTIRLDTILSLCHPAIGIYLATGLSLTAGIKRL